MKPGIMQRQVWRISGAYFNPSGSVLRLMCLAAIVFMTLFSYLPLGTLRRCLYYPGITTRTDDPAITTLRRCHLEHLIERLDQEEEWTRILSLGEQQRLSVGRVLLNRPAVVFLDEASSALDEALELAMYRLLRESLPRGNAGLRRP